MVFSTKNSILSTNKTPAPITNPPKVKLLMSWLTTLIAHSYLLSCTSSFLAPSPPPPPCRTMASRASFIAVVASPCHLHHDTNVCVCVVVVCVVAPRLGGRIIVCIVIHHLHRCPLLVSWHCCPLSASQRQCVHCCLLSALWQRLLRLRCCHCLCHGGIVCIIVCVVLCVSLSTLSLSAPSSSPLLG
jgi:hypothetical protein